MPTTEMSDKDFDRIIRFLHLSKRKEIINGLLSGNDTLCFTTMQYAEKMFSETAKIATSKDFQEYWLELAKSQLRDERLVEVSQDVWTTKLSACSPSDGKA